MICCKRLLVYTGKLPSRKVVLVYIYSDLHFMHKKLKNKRKSMVWTCWGKITQIRCRGHWGRGGGDVVFKYRNF